MKAKIKVFGDNYASIEFDGYYIVRVYIGSRLTDKVRTDDYRTAREYFRAFCKIAKNG